MRLLPLSPPWSLRLGLVLLAVPGAAQDSQELGDLSLEELLAVRIVSASNAVETVAQAPATVIVLTRQTIRERGYLELSEILDDLPGMEVVRPYGATYFKDYWRGYRNTIGDPFLLMLDGVILNHLYFDTADVLVTLPVSAVERIEVVYGPASAVYGANAFMGVVNVITRTPGEGSGGRVVLAAGPDGSRIADLHYRHRQGGLAVSVSARLDDGELDPDSGETYEYTSNRYLLDRRLWGGFLDNPSLAGAFSSPHRNRALDVRVELGSTEAGVHYFDLRSGYGAEYAADQAQSRAVWARPDVSAWIRTRRELGAAVTSTTLLRYRSSGVSNDSDFVVSTPGLDSAGQPAQLVDLSFWQSLNSSWSVFQDFEVRACSRLSLGAGFKYEQKDLQKAYDTADGPQVPADDLDASLYPYPNPPVATPQAQNRITTEDTGAYAHARWDVTPRHRLNLGMRVDHNSAYGTSTNLRAGYVGRYGAWSVKGLFGEAFQEPVPRLLYGGWEFSGSDPDLAPERSRTLELSAGRTTPRLGQLVSLYFVENRDTIVNTAGGARNLGDRHVVGLDYHLQARVHVPRLRELRVWGYYSRYLHVRESRVDAAGAPEGEGRIPDLADDQIRLGATAVLDGHWSLTALARRVGSRATIETNPVREVSGFTTFDVNLDAHDLFVAGLGASLRATNLFDATYFHPGVRDASAGTNPGEFDAAGVWHGSQGFYNSLLPQPGRRLTVALRLEL